MGLDSAAGQREEEVEEPAGRTLVWAGAWAAGADFAARPPAWELVGGGGLVGGRPRPGSSSQASSGHPWASSLYSPHASTICQQKNIWKMWEVLKQIGNLAKF